MRVRDIISYQISFLMCPIPGGVAWPHCRGLAGQNIFCYRAHKNCTRNGKGALLLWVGDFHCIREYGGISPHVCILFNTCFTQIYYQEKKPCNTKIQEVGVPYS